MPLQHDTIPMKEFHKSKTLLWDPRDIDLTQDKADWATLTADEQRLILHLSSIFLTGEAAVTHDLAPLLIALRRQGNRMEDEMFVTAQLYEESKHVEWFERWLAEVPNLPELPTFSGGSAYDQLFNHDLPDALNALLTDHSDAAVLRATCIYHMTIEGMLAETGYYAFSEMLRRNKLMPGLVKGIDLVKRDEARHIAFGIYLLQDLVARDSANFERIQATLMPMLGRVSAIVSEIFAQYNNQPPFGLQLNDFLSYAAGQFQARIGAIQRAVNNEPRVN